MTRSVVRVAILAIAATLIASSDWLTDRLGADSRLPGDTAAVGFAVLVSTVLLAVRLGRTYVVVRAAAGRARPPRTRSRSAGWYAAALVMTGLTALMPFVGVVTDISAASLAWIIAGGTLGSSLLFVTALLFMVDPAAGVAPQLRRVLDGISAGLCTMFTGWALLIAPRGSINALDFWLVMITSCVLATAAMAGLRNAGGRQGPALCAGGVIAAVLGLDGLALSVAHALSVGWSVAAGMALGLAVVLIWSGTRRSVAPRRVASRLARARAPLPVIALPAFAAVVVALHRICTGAAFDQAEILLGTLAALAVGLRQTRLQTHSEATPAVVKTPDAATAALGDTDDDAVARALYRRAYTDPVTGLANRRQVCLSLATLRCAPHVQGALLVIGLDPVRNEGGRVEAVRFDSGRPWRDVVHADVVLTEIARRLQVITASDGNHGDLAARLSESQFALITRANVAHAYARATRLLELLSEPVHLPGLSVHPSPSIGLTDLASASSVEDTIARAEKALRRATQLGAKHVEWYDAAVERAIARREIIERELPDVLRRGELDLIYQPVMDLVRKRPLGVEALLRWRHPLLGTLLPSDIIPVAEEHGMINEIGQWVLGEATNQLAAWRRDGRDISMMVNISPRELDGEGLAGTVGALLERHNVPAQRLIIELAESGLVDGEALEEQVGALRAVGVGTALDGFGTGPASLAQLRRLPIDMVKIGQSFFGGSDEGQNLPMIDVMVGVGRRLGFEVVAHGLEAEHQLKLVESAGCRLAQGHLFARPQPVEHTEAYLDAFGASRT